MHKASLFSPEARKARFSHWGKKFTGIFSSLVSSSRILSFLFRDSRAESLFGKSFLSSVLTEHPAFYRQKLSFKLAFAERSENSFLVSRFHVASLRFFSSSLRSFGIYFLSFGLFILSANLLNGFDRLRHLQFSDSFIFSLFLVILSLFMLPFSQISLASLIRGSSFFSPFSDSLFRINDIEKASALPVRMTTEFSLIFGLLCGVFSYVVSPKPVLLTLAAVFVFYLVITHPENGVLLLCFFTPFLDVRWLCLLSFLTFFSYLFKVLRAKRAFPLSFSMILLFFLLTAVLLACFVSYRHLPLFPMLETVSAVLAGICVLSLVRSTDMSKKCMRMLSLSAFLLSLVCAWDLLSTLLMADLLPALPSLSFPAMRSGADTAAYLCLLLPLFFSHSHYNMALLPLFSTFFLVFDMLFLHTGYAYLSVLIAYAVYLLFFNRRGWLILLSLVLIGFSVRYFIPENLFSQTQTFLLSVFEDPSIPVFADMSGLDSVSVLLTGIGITPFATLSNSNTYASLMWIFGLPLFIAVLLAFFVLPLRSLVFSVSPDLPKQVRKRTAVLFSALVSAMIAGFFCNVTADPCLLTLIFLIASLGIASPTASAHDTIPVGLPDEVRQSF